MISTNGPTMTAASSADTDKRRERVERALLALPVEIAAIRLNMTIEQMRDYCPDLIDDEPEPEGNPISGY